MTQKLLFVDSSASNATTFECFFRDAGFEVLCAASCNEAFRLLGKYSFDLIITDFDGPFVNGNAMVREIAGSPRPIPVIVHASDISSVIPSSVIKEVVLKPASIFQISEAIDKSLSAAVC